MQIYNPTQTGYRFTYGMGWFSCLLCLGFILRKREQRKLHLKRELQGAYAANCFGRADKSTQVGRKYKHYLQCIPEKMKRTGSKLNQGTCLDETILLRALKISSFTLRYRINLSRNSCDWQRRAIQAKRVSCYLRTCERKASQK